jgi:hypothetical protein
MPAQAIVSEQDIARSIAQAAQHFESYAHEVSRVVARRAVYWQTIKSLAERAGVSLAGFPIAADNDAATARAQRWQSWLTELDAGRAELVPWQRGNEPIRLAVRRAGAGPLGYWALVVQVLRLAVGAVLSGAAWLAADAWGETEKVDAEARRLDAATRAQLGELAKADPRLAPQILEAMAAADRAAAGAGPDWIDRLTTGLGAGLGGGMVALAVVWFLSMRGRRKNGRTRNRRRRLAR